MHRAVRYPGHDIQNGMFVSGEDIAQIGTVDYVFECRENADPDGRSIVGRNVLAAREQKDPCEYGEKR